MGTVFIEWGYPFGLKRWDLVHCYVSPGYPMSYILWNSLTALAISGRATIAGLSALLL